MGQRFPEGPGVEPGEPHPAHPRVDTEVEGRLAARSPAPKCGEVTDCRPEAVLPAGAFFRRGSRPDDENGAGDVRASQLKRLGDRDDAIPPGVERLQGARHSRRTQTVTIGLDHGEETSPGNRGDGPGVGDDCAEIDVGPGTGRRGRV